MLGSAGKWADACPPKLLQRKTTVNSQELQLLTDAVKIGFPVIGTVAGALIGGVTTYLLTRLGHKHDSRKELAKRRYELLMQTANDVTEFEHVVGTYATIVSNKVQGFKGALDFEEVKASVYNKNQPIRRARMALKVLGLAEAESQLEKYLDLTREMVRFGSNLPKERASELTKLIVRGPVEFYDALAKAMELGPSLEY